MRSLRHKQHSSMKSCRSNFKTSARGGPERNLKGCSHGKKQQPDDKGGGGARAFHSSKLNSSGRRDKRSRSQKARRALHSCLCARAPPTETEAGIDRRRPRGEREGIRDSVECSAAAGGLYTARDSSLEPDLVGSGFFRARKFLCSPRRPHTYVSLSLSPRASCARFSLFRLLALFRTHCATLASSLVFVRLLAVCGCPRGRICTGSCILMQPKMQRARARGKKLRIASRLRAE